MKTTTAALRRKLFGVLTASALGGAVTAALVAPSVTAASDPCTASEIARTVGSVAKSAGDYLDSHPETNQAMTSMLQQPAGPQSMESLKTYFDAHPKVQQDLQTIAGPLGGVATQCKLPISLPEVLGMMQAAQGQGGLPGGLPGGIPGGAPAPAAPSGPPPSTSAAPPKVIR